MGANDTRPVLGEEHQMGKVKGYIWISKTKIGELLVAGGSVALLVVAILFVVQSRIPWNCGL